MKKLLASTLTVLLFATTAFAQVDDHAKAKKGAVIGGIAGAIAGDIINRRRRGRHRGRRDRRRDDGQTGAPAPPDSGR